MKNFVILLMLILFLTLVVLSCSEDKNPLPSTSHPEEWNTVGAENFHGGKVLATGSSSCKSCHGIDLKGGESGESCFKCHQGYPHSDEWTIIGSSNFHAAYISANSDAMDRCKACHGSNLTGGKSGVSCFKCHQAGTLP